MTDARVLRTRAALHKSVLNLAARKPMSEVTVSELAELAQINRVTFYKHYATPGEALAEALNSMLLAACEDTSAYPASLDPFTACLHTTLDHLDAHRALYTVAFSDVTDGTVQMMLVRHLTTIAEIYLTKRRNRKPPIPNIDLDVAAAFLAAGAIGAIRLWALQGDMSRERFIENMSHFLPDWFHSEATSA